MEMYDSTSDWKKQIFDTNSDTHTKPLPPSVLIEVDDSCLAAHNYDGQPSLSYTCNSYDESASINFIGDMISDNDLSIRPRNISNSSTT